MVLDIGREEEGRKGGREEGAGGGRDERKEKREARGQEESSLRKKMVLG